MYKDAYDKFRNERIVGTYGFMGSLNLVVIGTDIFQSPMT